VAGEDTRGSLRRLARFVPANGTAYIVDRVRRCWRIWRVAEYPPYGTAKRDFRFASSFYLYYALRGEGRYFRLHFGVGLVRSSLSFLRRVGESRQTRIISELFICNRARKRYLAFARK